MAHKDKRGGTLIVDRVFPAVGRIKRASGTTKPKTFRKINEDLTALYEAGRLDVLRDVRDKRRTFLELREIVQRVGRDKLEKIASAGALDALATAWNAWIDQYRTLHPARNPNARRDHHLNSLRQSLRHFERVNAKARVADLPAVLERLRTTLGMKHPRAFVLVRSNAMAFVRDTLKKNHPLHAEIGAVLPVEVRAKRKKAPQRAAAFARLAERMSPDVAACAWSMASTGMGAEEYWGTWERRPHAIHIEGTKREGRIRDVPDVGIAVAPPIGRAWFEVQFREQMQGAMTPYDLRRTFARWLQEAEIPRTRRRMYYGHGKRDVSDEYEEYEVLEYLERDGAKLRALLGRAKRGQLKLAKGGRHG